MHLHQLQLYLGGTCAGTTRAVQDPTLKLYQDTHRSVQYVPVRRTRRAQRRQLRILVLMDILGYYNKRKAVLVHVVLDLFDSILLHVVDVVIAISISRYIYG